MTNGHCTLYKTSISTDAGILVIVADNRGLNRIFLPPHQQGEKDLLREDKNHKHPVIADTIKQLGEYFRKKREHFNLPISPVGTNFQHAVWQLISTIPYGKTASYGSLAEIIGDRNKARAVGGAAHHNPLPIIIPCHRLIGINGQLTGFAGGLEMKKLLLKLEGHLPTCQ